MATYHYQVVTAKQIKELIQETNKGSTCEKDLKFKVDGQRINIESTSCNYGGMRYYFICPMCGKRCYKLFKLQRITIGDALYKDVNTPIACNTCINYNRRTLNRTKNDPYYYYELAYKEAKKLNPNYKRHEYMQAMLCPFKPKHMRWNTYITHRQRFMKYMNKGDRLLNIRMNDILSSMNL